MTNEELVQLYQNGDKQALNELVENNTGIVYKLANKFYVNMTSSIDKDDLIQEGFIGLMAAADKYKLDIQHPCKFITYAVYWIYQKIQRYMSQKNTNEESSLNTHIGEDSKTESMDNIKDIDYSYENIEDKIYNKQLRKEIEKVMFDNLTLKEREILKLRYGWDNKCMSFEEVAEVFTLTRQNVIYTEKKAIRNIRHTSWGRVKAKEYCKEKYSNEKYSISDKIKALDFRTQYLENENTYRWRPNL